MIPTPREVIREATVVIAGAVLAAFIVGQFPRLKSWITDQWRN